MIEYKAFDWDIISFSVEYFSKLKIRAALKLTESRRLSMRDNGNIKNNSNIRIADKKIIKLKKRIIDVKVKFEILFQISPNYFK